MARATLYAAADGTILRFLQTDAEHAQYPDPPPGATQAVAFDTDTNPTLALALLADWDAHRVVSGTLQRNGQTVAIAPESPATIDRANVRTLLAKLEGETALTPAELRSVLRHLIRRVDALEVGNGGSGPVVGGRNLSAGAGGSG